MPKGYYRSNAAHDNQHNAEGAVGLDEVHAGPDNVYLTVDADPGGLHDVPFDQVAPIRYPFPKDTITTGRLRDRSDAHKAT